MALIKSRDTKPELLVRKTAHALGYRFRLQRNDLPGKPDIVFPARRKVIFVHGCFWHQHPFAGCRDAKMPKSNQGYWQPKLARNIARDAQHIADIEARGWNVLVIWECEAKRGPGLAARLRQFLGP